MRIAEHPEFDQSLERYIFNIWDIYDTDGSNYLDKEEVKRFLGLTYEKNPELGSINMESFDAVYIKIDNNQSGNVSKKELLPFMKSAIIQRIEVYK